MSKIIDGLKSALRYARCAHSFRVVDVRCVSDDRFAVGMVCLKCRSRTTVYHDNAGVTPELRAAYERYKIITGQ